MQARWGGGSALLRPLEERRPRRCKVPRLRRAPGAPRHGESVLLRRREPGGPDDLIAFDLAAELVPRQTESVQRDVQRERDVRAAERGGIEHLAAVAGASDTLEHLELVKSQSQPPATRAGTIHR